MGDKRTYYGCGLYILYSIFIFGIKVPIESAYSVSPMFFVMLLVTEDNTSH